MDRCSRSEPNGVAAEASEPEKEQALEDDEGKLEEDGRADRSKAGSECDQEGNHHGSSRLEEGGGGSPVGKEAANEPTGGRGTDRRYSTLAR